MTHDSIFELQHVSVPSRRDPDLAVVDDLTWTVRPGEFWVVGGLQGAGKSDLLFMLAGLSRPIDGVYTLFGHDMTARFGDEFLPNRLRVGIVFDDARLFNHLSISENVALPIRYHQNLAPEESEGWVNALLQTTQVAELAYQTPSMLTRAWRRRAALARALALRPELLFFENPLRGLDARHMRWWIRFIVELSRGHSISGGKPLTIVASTDEFAPWRDSGAQFAVLHGRHMEVAGSVAPVDEVQLDTFVAGKEE